MRSLVIEDEETSSLMLKEFLSEYGACDIASNGREGFTKFKDQFNKGTPYQLICMDIMMPAMDGQETLRKIREYEKNEGIESGNKVKVIMTTALEDQKNVTEAFLKGEAASYIVKPINKKKFLREIRKLGMID